MKNIPPISGRLNLCPVVDTVRRCSAAQFRNNIPLSRIGSSSKIRTVYIHLVCACLPIPDALPGNPPDPPRTLTCLSCLPGLLSIVFVDLENLGFQLTPTLPGTYRIGTRGWGLSKVYY
jgi:hypothetical protein